MFCEIIFNMLVLSFLQCLTYFSRKNTLGSFIWVFLCIELINEYILYQEGMYLSNTSKQTNTHTYNKTNKEIKKNEAKHRFWQIRSKPCVNN